MALEDNQPYDLITLDIMMPIKDGHESLKAIREEEEKKGILGFDGVNVIMMSAFGDHEHILKAFRGGCESYIIKPVTRKKLAEQLESLELVA